MSFETWLAFAVAASVIILIPGPTVMMLVGYGLARGRGIALFTMPGVALGNLLAITLAFAGVGALLATSALLFTIVKWVGAAYLIWLGIGLWRAKPEAPGKRQSHHRQKPKRIFFHAFAITALNPKSIAFFMAFLPQFMSSDAALLPQYLILTLTWVAVSAIFDSVYALAAGTARETIQQPSIAKAVNRLGGSVMIGAGIAMAAMRRST
ncbi:MAG: LysE family translocator [Hyphomicrobiales bacterium]|nr:LysE family translocator [Hyphomicrobiales bacterium]